MEDRDIGGMYVATVKKWFWSLYDAVWRRGLMRSGILTVVVLAAALLGLALAYRAHMQGNFHKLKLKANIDSERQEAPVPRPGGQDAIVLTRSWMTGDATPEFLSATLLPGRGMNVLQITAYIPGRGEVNLLASPTVEGAAAAMTGKGADENGQASLAMGGAFEAPWAGGLWTEPPRSGQQAPNWPGPGGARGGLMLAEPSDTANSETLPDGGSAEATFNAGDFGGHWPSKTSVTANVLLSRDTIELTVVATNNGDAAEPIGIGWQPRFAILNGREEGLRLHVPAASRLEMRDGADGLPTGNVVPVAGTPYDYSAAGGATLKTKGLDEYFVGLHQGFLDNGPVTELIDPLNRFGLRLTAMSPTIRVIHVAAPADGEFVSIDPEYNYPNPFGREWDKETDAGMVTLEPGQSTEWKVKLELFPVTGGTAAQP